MMDNIKTNNNKVNYHLDVSGSVILDEPDKDYFILIRKETGSWITINKSKSDIIKDLENKGILYDEYKHRYPEDIELLKSLFEAGLLNINNKPLVRDDIFKACDNSNTHPSLFVINYTKKCNLKCSYCYVESDNKQNFSMNNEDILYIIKRMIDAYGDNIYTLVLHGGEPALRFKDMPLLIRDLKKISPRIIVNIQTNATLITKKIAKFLKKENIRVGVSLDGIDDKTNIHRHYSNGKSSVYRSLKGLEELLLAGINPGILSVITSDNQYEILDIFNFFVERGIKDFGFNPFFPGGRGKDEKHEIDIKALVNNQIKLIRKIDTINSRLERKNEYIAERNISNLIINLTSLDRHYMCAMSPCGSGRMTLAFDTDGSIYPCDDFISQKDFCIGNIYEVEDIKYSIQKSLIVKRLIEHNVDNTEECSICLWKRICTFHCASDTFFRNNSFNHPHSMCLYIKSIIPLIIDLLHNKLIDPKHFIPC